MSPRNSTEIGQRRSYAFRGKVYPSVTTILKAWPMEWAIAYGAKHVAERAVFQHSELTERLNSDDPIDWTLKWLKAAPTQRRDAAADVGTNLHAYLESRARGDAPPETLTPGQVAVEQFLDTYRPDFLAIECQVFSTSEGYAGSADFFATIYGRRVVGDLKTGFLSHQARLQLAAYRYADFIGADDEVVSPIPECEGAMVLHIPRDDPRSWMPVEVEAGPHEYAKFLHTKSLWDFYDGTKKEAVGESILPQIREVPDVA
jgi:hypothetical protein